MFAISDRDGMSADLPFCLTARQGAVWPLQPKVGDPHACGLVTGHFCHLARTAALVSVAVNHCISPLACSDDWGEIFIAPTQVCHAISMPLTS